VKLDEQITSISRGSAEVAALLAASDPSESPEIWIAGRLSLLASKKIGFFCSAQCPGSIVLKAFDVVAKMRDEGQVLMGGFHSVMEWECLRILLRGRQPVIWVPARSIVGMRLKPDLQPAFKNGRLLILSPFAPTPAHARVTAALAQQRNRFVGALADRIFVPHAAPGSRTLALCDELHQAGKRIVTVQDPRNSPLESLSPEYLENGPISVTGGGH
jgi:predicted Rossmann fold nucleotide-binding protein DprA/Smf involved in DNA uptake